MSLTCLKSAKFTEVFNWLLNQKLASKARVAKKISKKEIVLTDSKYWDSIISLDLF